MLGTVFALPEAERNLKQRCDSQRVFDLFRTRLAQSILIGVEFLIAADIVGTVKIEPTMESFCALAVFVFIRTFLSVTLEIEVEGRRLWQRGRNRQKEN